MSSRTDLALSLRRTFGASPPTWATASSEARRLALLRRRPLFSAPRPFVLGLIAVDCVPYCTLWPGLRKLSFEPVLKFASDIDRGVRRFVDSVSPPEIWYEDLLHRDNWSPETREVDVYSGGFPCQPFSSAGLQQGLLDARGTVFYGCADFIDAKRPLVFVLENVRGLLSHDSGRTFDHVLKVLATIGHGVYDVRHSLLNTEHSGVPQHRPRVYIVGRLLSRCLEPFRFPEPLPSVGIDSLLDPRCDGESWTARPGTMAAANLQEALADIAKSGLDPLEQHFIIDIDSSKRFRSVMLDRSPCLLKARPRGFYISSRGRRMSVAEMCRLQGYEPFRTDVVSSCALGGMLGNAMSLNVVPRLLAAVLPTVGLVSEVPLIEATGLDASRASCSPAADTHLHDAGPDSLLRCWCSTVLGSTCPFGVFAKTFVEGGFPVSKDRCRDLLPLPRAREEDLHGWTPRIDRSTAVTLLNISCAGLNYLFLDGEQGALPRSTTSLHCAVFSRLRAKLDDAFAELTDEDRGPDVAGAFGRLTSVTSAQRYPPLRADGVDVLAVSANIDPLAYVPQTVRDLLTTPTALFP